jgi:glutamate 5-kinase
VAAKNNNFPKASVIIKENTAQALKDKSATNIMTSGVEKVEGFFEADDLVKIYDEKGKQLGIGKVKYSSDEINNPQKTDNIKLFIDKDFLLLYKY